MCHVCERVCVAGKEIKENPDFCLSATVFKYIVVKRDGEFVWGGQYFTEAGADEWTNYWYPTIPARLLWLVQGSASVA